MYRGNIPGLLYRHLYLYSSFIDVGHTRMSFNSARHNEPNGTDVRVEGGDGEQ